MYYLSEEEQYKDILNNDEIKRIKDAELRAIRYKYWKMQFEAFKDEQKYSDDEIKEVWERLHKEEWAEIEEYKKKKATADNIQK